MGEMGGWAKKKRKQKNLQNLRLDLRLTPILAHVANDLDGE